ncbi:hypothetical protein L6452_15947 [Arctium lappa]|uniref:Uncharacterized protein n=1 Tax=Arctium lappa TaxID=4217 RepID=A0ACB9CQF1_ARCLA|nr:hypothetical protein L6452_15947 [Arctium lappa]
MSNRQGGFKGGHEGEGGTGVEEKDSASVIGNLDLAEKGTEPEGQSITKEESPEPPKDDRKNEGSGKSVEKGAEPFPRRGVANSETIGTEAIMGEDSSNSKEKGEGDSDQKDNSKTDPTIFFGNEIPYGPHKESGPIEVLKKQIGGAQGVSGLEVNSGSPKKSVGLNDTKRLEVQTGNGTEDLGSNLENIVATNIRDAVTRRGTDGRVSFHHTKQLARSNKKPKHSLGRNSQSKNGEGSISEATKLALSNELKSVDSQEGFEVFADRYEGCDNLKAAGSPQRCLWNLDYGAIFLMNAGVA